MVSMFEAYDPSFVVQDLDGPAHVSHAHVYSIDDNQALINLPNIYATKHTSHLW